MVTTTKKPVATPAAAAKPAAKKAVATKTAAAPKVAAPVVVPVAAPLVAPKAKAAAAKPVAATPVAAKPAAAKPAAKKASATQLKPSTAPVPVLSSEQRTHYVSVAAFYIAERRGFTLGNPADDWLAAEAEVDRLIASGHFTA
ncbi:MAG: hypothetical protein BWK72_01810 [Rhodoferax ferrireducens]|uniref:DUF2934 domain-containing protein n=1 Tax=Rhodoferax ferrireducens TaxID=192843 RepID=A0A1W9KZ28_9BURK|nr:MAG: hypothetical protein BWK72_01810 [Rhodoferax ferrireducens]